MVQSAQIRVCDRVPEHSLPARVAVLVLLAAFCFQLSRFYIAIPLCSHHTRDGLALQHCKDPLSGLVMNRVQLGVVSAALWQPILETAPTGLPGDSVPIHDVPLPPPFHPPRS